MTKMDVGMVMNMVNAACSYDIVQRKRTGRQTESLWLDLKHVVHIKQTKNM